MASSRSTPGRRDAMTKLVGAVADQRPPAGAATAGSGASGAVGRWLPAGVLIDRRRDPVRRHRTGGNVRSDGRYSSARGGRECCSSAADGPQPAGIPLDAPAEALVDVGGHRCGGRPARRLPDSRPGARQVFGVLAVAGHPDREHPVPSRAERTLLGLPTQLAEQGPGLGHGFQGSRIGNEVEQTIEPATRIAGRPSGHNITHLVARLPVVGAAGAVRVAAAPAGMAGYGCEIGGAGEAAGAVEGSRAATHSPATRNRATDSRAGAGSRIATRNRATGTRVATRNRATGTRVATHSRATDSRAATCNRATGSRAGAGSPATGSRTATHSPATCSRIATRNRAAGSRGAAGGRGAVGLWGLCGVRGGGAGQGVDRLGVLGLVVAVLDQGVVAGPLVEGPRFLCQSRGRRRGRVLRIRQVQGGRGHGGDVAGCAVVRRPRLVDGRSPRAARWRMRSPGASGLCDRPRSTQEGGDR